MAAINLATAARFSRELPHQIAAWNWLQEQLPAATLAEFAELFRAAPGPAPAAPPSSRLQLKVPYQSQLDNKSGAGQRECFSSSCAMVAMFYGLVASDDEYNKLRARFGDTTDAGAQLRALGSLGLVARFRQDGNAATLERLLRAGQPVPVGWLHRGPVDRPTGGGHWSVVIGFTPEAFIHHDPNGEAAMLQGGYVNHSGGAAVEYSRQNWQRRWEADGTGSGWYLDISRPAAPATPAPAAAAAPAVDWLTPARNIVQEFEGCRLDAYLCPAGVWTIGWGATGPSVREGRRWTQAHADAVLDSNLRGFHAGLVEALPMMRQWSGERQAALTSWAFNVGLDAVRTSTLRQRLVAGQDPVTVIREELPRWDKANAQQLPGLTRRRAAEVALFTQGA